MTTCSPLFKQALEHAERESYTLRESFFWGFLTGQAEKVWLGACAAFMVRPSSIEDTGDPTGSRLLERVHTICEIYSLECRIVASARGPEFWIFRPDKQPLLDLLDRLDDSGSRTAHFIRGTLCGVPSSELDLAFHERYPTEKRE